MKNENRDCKKWSSADTIHAKQKFNEEKISDGCSYFFKVLLGDFSQKLSIPPAFVPKLIQEADLITVLHVPSGRQWVVKLCGTSTGLEFGQGWENFVHDQRLELGDFLVFKYICRSKFKVWIFGKSGCEKNSTVFESEETHYDLQKICPNSIIASAVTRNSAQPTDSHLLIDLVSDEEDKNEVAENQGKVPKSSSSSPCCPPKNPMHCHPSLAGEKRNLEKSSAEIETENRSYLGTYYISRRRPVTEAERNKTLKEAKSFKSDKPFSSVLMMPSHVYHGFWMGVPKQCIRTLQLPSENFDMILVDANSKEWQVRYRWNGSRANLSKGWRPFSFSNNLEEGDVCIFERVDHSIHKIKLRVHIFRIVKKITPYKRMLGKITGNSITLPTNHSKKMKVSNEYLAIDMSVKAFEPDGKDAEQVKKTNDSNSAPRNHSKNMKFLQEDLVTNLSGKASEPEQGKNAKQGVIQAKKEKTSNVDNRSKLVNSKCIQAISERKTGCRRSPRLAQICNKVPCPQKKLLHQEPSVNGHKSIAKDTKVLPKMITCVADVNGEEDDLMIIWDSNSLSRYSAL
ncbi:B3 domain-containing protein Os01g0723500 isoform X2 [Cryptomeria japonica]|uniref:B3 domain-containing protein Os01g0723500 isoform X2 n=1 Tax=Cryptomeria japonica TaxID=3369 RepID=UPI0027DA1AC1|nr:B3 domain-containing protein Os01g0723500 isoform X2 [Cryptomeria japonica]